MATRTKASNQTESVWLLDFLQKYWMLILGTIFAYPYVMRYLRDAQTKKEVNNIQEDEKLLAVKVEHPKTQLDVFNTVTTNTSYHNIAKNIAVALGTDKLNKEAGAIAWTVNPSSWFEDDKKAFDNLRLLINSGQVKTVTELYYDITRRDLSFDVKNLLDEKYLKQLRFFK
jgi:hypothetical protein